jgi:hypothetical protein
MRRNGTPPLHHAPITRRPTREACALLAPAQPEIPMNIRTCCFVCAALPLMLAGGCTTAYKNAGLCKAKVQADYPNAASAPLKITEAKAAYEGARVVVRGETTAAPKPPAKKKVVGNAAAECTFDGDSLSGFQWLSPPDLAARPAPALR